jgi:arylsulfatase
VSRFDQRWELYDIEADRTELHDLTASKDGVIKELTGMYELWAKRAGVQPWDKINPEKK